METFYLVALGVLGAAFGSFANVVIYRFPRGESLVSPPSHCPSCGRPIRPRDNVPLVSWLVLRGRCRDCGARISVRYPIVEALSATLWVLAGFVWGVSLATVVAVIAFYLLLILTFIDIDTQRLPNPLVAILGGVGLLGVIASSVTGLQAAPLTLAPEGPSVQPVTMALVGVALGAGVSLAIALAYERVRGRQGFGMGDVKLLAALGLLVGPYVLVAFLAGSIVGAVWGLVATRSAREGLTAKVPFGPFLAIGAIIAAVWGPALVSWYLEVLAVTS